MTIALFDPTVLNNVILALAFEAGQLQWTRSRVSPTCSNPRLLFETHYDYQHSVMLSFDQPDELEVFLMDRQGNFINRGTTSTEMPSEVNQAVEFLRFVVAGQEAWPASV